MLLSFNFRNYCISCLSPKIYLAVVIKRIEGTFLITCVQFLLPFSMFLEFLPSSLSFSSFFSAVSHAFAPNLSRQQQIRRMPSGFILHVEL